jgi:hypothetical protein
VKSIGQALLRHRVVVPLAIVALVIAALGGVLTAQAGRHSHKVKMVYATKAKTLAGNDVNFVLVFCPGGTKATGFGANTSGNGVGVVVQQDLSSDSGSALFQNISGSSATMHGKLACIKKGTSSTRGKVSPAEKSAALAAIRDRRDKLEAELND